MMQKKENSRVTIAMATMAAVLFGCLAILYGLHIVLSGPYTRLLVGAFATASFFLALSAVLQTIDHRKQSSNTRTEVSNA